MGLGRGESENIVADQAEQQQGYRGVIYPIFACTIEA
jgi:hypothetical protein